MNQPLENQSLNYKSLILLFVILYYWFYINVYFGYLLSNWVFIWYDYYKFNTISSINFRKNLNLTNSIKSALSEYLQDLYPSFFELNKAEDCLKITPQTVEYINPSPLQIMLEQQEKIPQIPFPILGDPYLSIEIDWEWDDSRNSKYKFELFTFYKNINEKLQS